MKSIAQMEDTFLEFYSCVSNKKEIFFYKSQLTINIEFVCECNGLFAPFCSQLKVHNIYYLNRTNLALGKFLSFIQSFRNRSS